MNWFIDLFTGQGVAQTVLLFSMVIAIGIPLGKIKIKGVSLGITLVLFVGIAFGELGFRVNHEVLHFIKEFGLILFVFSVGMQVGPSFFSSFKKGGVKFNLLATSIVFIGVLTCVIIYFVTGIPMATMVGILSGAITNTPGLGAAQQAFMDMHAGNNSPEIQELAKSIPMGYACAYPFGVVGIILSLIVIRLLFKVNLEKEKALVESDGNTSKLPPKLISLEVENTAIINRRIEEVANTMKKEFVISRVLHADNNVIEIASSQTQLKKGDKLLVITNSMDADSIIQWIGKEIEMEEHEWYELDAQLISRRIIVTHDSLNGKKLGQLKLRTIYGVNVTRVNRAGIDLVANANLTLQVGDRVTVVGTESAIQKIEKMMGNQLKRLREPNVLPIFIGIALGIILGSIPFIIPGIPKPVKLGLAGGPLIISILISRFGYKYKLVTYSTVSSNLMLRELGIILFLASVGLGAGDGFLHTIVNGGGLLWVILGFIITIVPILFIGIIGRKIMKINYFSLMGLIAGSTTDPPALAYANSTANSDLPAVTYATVYPLTMFLRVLSAQLLILLFC